MPAAELAELAALLADRTRAAVLVALLDGRAWTAGELARAAGVAPPTASAHLTRLVEAGLLREHRQGRHRYVRLAGPEEAALLEHLLAYAGPGRPAPTLRAATASAALARGRTCYDHLAGRLGVALADALVARDLLTADLTTTPAGLAWFDALGADFTGTRRPVTRACLDWTERRPHLAGAAGAHLCAWLHDRGWVRRSGTGRAVAVTDDGRVALADLLGLVAP
ncbi:ArsR/SmtB family transcription factor [Saccharothrix obliqua]|uniref:ArsR/SmtB family transcription factor n=1 Tax=Saccharothrix obliqua TaxID=2861747 RepID=UPI001C601379|nr:winged helix-turn-helix domain-containing protein [Saccharothrix obliqua]MBW4716375.1 winged helix-turn-helix domain-containing protein [Saccharothrix obliqua]